LKALRNGLLGCQNRISAQRIAGAQEPAAKAASRIMNSIACGDLLRLQQHPRPTFLGDAPKFSALVRGRSKRFLGNAKTSTWDLGHSACQHPRAAILEAYATLAPDGCDFYFVAIPDYYAD
jgi:hypothetical protein